jgi:hypothetical protein
VSDSLPARRRARALELWQDRRTTREIASSPDVPGGDRPTLFGSSAAASKAVRAARVEHNDGAAARLLDGRDQDVATIDRMVRAMALAADAGNANAARAGRELLEQRATLLGYRAQDDPESRVEQNDRAIAEQYAEDVRDALASIAPSEAQRAQFVAHLTWSQERRAALAGSPRGTEYPVPAPVLPARPVAQLAAVPDDDPAL